MKRLLAFSALLALVCLVPLILVAARAFTDLELGEIWELWTTESNLQALWNTLTMAALTAVFGAALGLFLAIIVARTDLPGRRWFGRLFPLPFLIPPYIGAIAWINLANPSVGWINRLSDASLVDIYTLGGIVWVFTLFFYSMVFLAVRAALENMDASLEEAARVSGASQLQVFLHVTVPLIRPVVISSAVLVFAAAAAGFGVPAMVGTPGRVFVLTTKIYSYFGTGGLRGPPRAAALAVLLLAVPMILFWWSERWNSRRRHAVVTGKATRTRQVSLGRYRWPVFALVLAIALVVVVLPMAVVAFSSVVRHAGDLSPGGWTLSRYRDLLHPDSELGGCLVNSLLLGIGAATIAVAIGVLIAFAKQRSRSRLGRLPDSIASVPYACPGTVLALGLILLFTRPIYLVNSVWILVIAYVVKYMAFAARTAADNLGQIDVSLEEAARVSGAGPLTVARTIGLPLMLPGLVAGWFLVFLPAFSELTMSVLLVGPGTQTVGTFLFDLQEYKDPPSGSVLAVVIIAVVLASNGLVRGLTRGRFGL